MSLPALPALRGPVSLIADSTLGQILGHFPKKVNYAFAYGSAVFGQQGQRSGKMLDIIFVVDSPVTWHKENMALNRDHYSALKYFGPGVIAKIQERMASGVYYNPFVRVGDQLIKYGVISTGALERDLTTWNQLYIAGRLHKPILELLPPASATLKKALHSNRESALRAVLLQEGRSLTKFDLFHGITELSYLGDSRMKLAENPEKTKNIVTPLMAEFERVYTPLLQGLRPMVEENPEGLLIQNTRPQERFLHLMALPIHIQISLCRQMFRDPRLCDIEEIMAEISYIPNLRRLIRNAVTDVVWGSSILQTLQGLLSAGFRRSWQYAKEKLQKGREGRRSRREAERMERWREEEELNNYSDPSLTVPILKDDKAQGENPNPKPIQEDKVLGGGGGGIKVKVKNQNIEEQEISVEEKELKDEDKAEGGGPLNEKEMEKKKKSTKQQI